MSDFLDKVVELVGGGSVINGAYLVKFKMPNQLTELYYLRLRRCLDYVSMIQTRCSHPCLPKECVWQDSCSSWLLNCTVLKVLVVNRIAVSIVLQYSY